MAMFNHGNIRISLGLDRILRYFVVTPDMHRVNHSVIIRETNSNYGFNLSWWDRLFGTYWAQPANGHTAMTIGLSQFRNGKRLTLPWLIVLPMIGDPGKQQLIATNRYSIENSIRLFKLIVLFLLQRSDAGRFIQPH
jgi:hypothetical protein